MRIVRWMFVFVCLSLVVVAVSCSDSEDAACGTSDDCPVDQICSEGVCRSPSGAVCMGDPDCPGGYQCVSNRCERRQPEPDAGNNTDPNNTDPNNSSMEDMGMPNNTSNDNVNPEVVTFSPEDGTGNVALDASITIEFNEAVQEVTLNSLSLPLTDGSNNVIATTVTYDEETLTATIVPNAPLREATPYIIEATRNVRDIAGNRLIEENATFYTVYEEPAHHTAVAETYAPVIYQDIRDDSSTANANGDIPTTVDFDGNDSAADNVDNARVGDNVRASVYYDVVESQTHYFIHYTLYYPWRYDENADEIIPHDFSGLVVVVEKETGDVVLVEGAALRGEEVPIGYGIEGKGVSVVGNKVDAWGTLNANELIDGTRFPLYITPSDHEACAWPKGGSFFPISICIHAESTFAGASGVVMRHGETGGLFSEATDTDNDQLLDLTYQLVPLPSTLWSRRSEIGPTKYWESSNVYRPEGERAATPEGVDGSLFLPTRLAAPRDENNVPVDSFGRPPFQWFEEPGTNNAGQWLLDPAFSMTLRYNFPTGFSQDYCLNPFLDVDNLDDPTVAECATPVD